MKILHTADWHLGKRLDTFSRLEEQQLVMNEIVQIADKHAVDMVIVAGDLFDTFNPGVEAVELLYKTLKRLSKNGERPVIAIAGNHDSPDRIDAPDSLARECGILLIGYPNAQVQTLELDAFSITKSQQGFLEIKCNSIPYPIRVLHTPYANEIRLKQFLGTEDKEQTLNDVLEEKWNKLANENCDSNGVNILTAHLFMMKRNGERLAEPDGEKPIMIGNADMIYTDCIPEKIQYTALGHLHAFRNIQTPEKPVVYSSSPLCYSFSEAGQTKYVSIIDIEPNQVAKFEGIPLENGRPLYRKVFSSVNETVEWLLENPYTLVELTVETDTYLSTDERKRILQAHDGIIYLIPKVKQILNTEMEEKSVNINQSIEDLFTDYFISKHKGQAPNEEIMNLFDEIIKEKK